MTSYLKRTDLPRGLRNNNPGNLIKTNIKWQGKIVPGADDRFEQFISIEHGIRAKLIDIINDIGKGANTIEKLITQYAPPFENNTALYIQRVVQATGLKPDETIKITDTLLKQLSRVIMEVENGKIANDLIKDSSISKAIEMLPDSVKKKLLL